MKRRSKRRSVVEDESEEGEGEGEEEEEEDDGGPSEHALRRCRRPGVSFTGARDGDVVEGTNPGNTEGCVMRVIGGDIAGAYRVFETGGRQAYEALARVRGVAYEAAVREVEEGVKSGSYDSLPAHQALGKTCSCKAEKCCQCDTSARLVVVQPGPLREHAEEAGHGEELAELVTSGRAVTWSTVLAMLGKHTLALQRGWYRVGTPMSAPPVGWEGFVLEVNGEGECRCRRETVSDGAGRAMVVCGDPAVALLIESDRPLGRQGKMQADEAMRLAAEACGGDEISAREVEAVSGFLGSLTPGELRSALQKTIRFGAEFVGGLGGDHDRVRSEVFAAATLAFLMANSGSFVPDYGLFVRGVTSAFKRLGVILYEDAWASSGCLHPVVLFAVSYYCHALPEWNPPTSLMSLALKTAVAACKCHSVVVLPAGNTKLSVESFASPEEFQEVSSSEALRTASFLLGKLRSFSGDLALAYRTAKAGYPVQLKDSSRVSQSQVMPVHHFIDQHAHRGVGHILEGAETFEYKFEQLFKRVTGTNPRRGVLVVESDPFVLRARDAQEKYFKLAYGQRAQTISTADGKSLSVKHPVDPGVLAAAVGPIKVTCRVRDAGAKKKRGMIVTLGTTEPEDEVVMLEPSRNSADLYGKISTAEREDAIAQAREMSHKLRSPMQLGSTATFESERQLWCVDGELWAEVRSRLGSFDFGVLVSEIPRTTDGRLDVAALVERAVTAEATGVVDGAEECVTELAAMQPRRVLLRALSMMRQKHERVTLPLPGRDGKKAADQQSAYAIDSAVYRFLLCVSALVPSALVPNRSVPSFRVPSPQLLRFVESLVAGVASRGGATTSEQVGEATDTTGWEFSEPQKLLRHQEDAVAEMIERDSNGSRGHFVFMDTGSGKTLVSVAYLSKLAQTGALPKYVLWVIPKAAVKDILDRIERAGGQACLLPISKRAAGQGAGKGARPVEYRINVVCNDHLRTVIDSLVEVAQDLVLVGDEADTCYEKTMRTSAALEIAALSRKIICQTATPMRSTRSEGLATWLSLMVDFPIDKKNWWVAANGIVSKQLDLGIALEERLETIPFAKEIEDQYKDHLRERRWLAAATCVWDATDSSMAKVAIAAATEYAGVLLVARDEAHADRLVGLVGSTKAKRFNSSEQEPGSDVVVVTKSQCRGYNWATRLGAIVRGEYPSNAADRKQMVGRIRRIGQRRATVHEIVVVMGSTIVEILHERHHLANSVNCSLEELGQLYERSLFDALCAH